MILQMLRPVTFTALMLSVGSLSAQEAKTEPADKAADVPNPALDSCVTLPAVDMTVMSDQYVYVRTRGSNQYLMETAECKDLLRSYLREEVELVPYGRRVCQNDGSYLLYRTDGRDLPCQILTIHRVANRAEARSIVQKNQSLIDVEKVAPPK
jgi:Family of unknown function (DUF6491)